MMKTRLFHVDTKYEVALLTVMVPAECRDINTVYETIRVSRQVAFSPAHMQSSNASFSFTG